MKLVEYSNSFGWKVHELAWNLHEFEFAFLEVILPKEHKLYASNTSRKHCEKKLQSFSHCDSFDHHDMQSLNNCKFFFFVLRMQFFGGDVIHCWKGIFNTFQAVH